MEAPGQKPRLASTVFGALPPEIWRHIKDMWGGRDFWLKKFRAAVLPCIPRTTYRFSFVGVWSIGGTRYIISYNECALRPGLTRRGSDRRPVRGRRPMRKVYEIYQIKVAPA